MSLAEPNFHAELVAHYSAVRARLWPQQLRPVTIQAPPGQSAPTEIDLPSRPEPESTIPERALSVEEIAARWRGIDESLFNGHVSPEAIIHITAAYFKVDVGKLIGPKRIYRLSRVRQAGMYIMRTLCRTSLCKTGSHFKRSHATARHTIYIARKRITEDPIFSTAVAEIIDLLVRTKA